jgi:hypothetical protein
MDKNIYRFFVNFFKLIICVIWALILLSLAVSLTYSGRYGSSIIFLILSGIFCFAATINGSIIHISPSCVKQTLFCFTINEILLSDIREICVAGVNVLNSRNPSKTGSLYIYISSVQMNDKERFDMCLKWPPFDKIHLLYTPERIAAIQTVWDKKIMTYNTDELFSGH